MGSLALELRLEYYRTAAGQRVVTDEVKAWGLDPRGLVKWNSTLTRIRTGTAVPGVDFKRLRPYPDLFEARLKYDGCEYRMLYWQPPGENALLLASRAFKKKGQKTPPGHIRVAQRRLRDWLDRRSGGAL